MEYKTSTSFFLFYLEA